jgi:ATP synthase protein I
MAEDKSPRRSPTQDAFSRTVAAQEKRKLRAQRTHSQVWSGLGMLGLVGWSIGVPTLLGIFLGLWLDKRYPRGHSWTLSLLFAGLSLGCLNAWHWLTREQKEIHREEEQDP